MPGDVRHHHSEVEVDEPVFFRIFTRLGGKEFPHVPFVAIPDIVDQRDGEPRAARVPEFDPLHVRVEQHVLDAGRPVPLALSGIPDRQLQPVPVRATAQLRIARDEQDLFFPEHFGLQSFIGDLAAQLSLG